MVMAFSGKARSGKSTSAHALKSLDERCVVLSFAQELKRMVMEQFPEVTAEHIARKSDIVTLGGKPIHVRQLLIEFGSMYRRICPDFWVMKLNIEMNNSELIVITDDVDVVSPYAPYYASMLPVFGKNDIGFSTACKVANILIKPQRL